MRYRRISWSAIASRPSSKGGKLTSGSSSVLGLVLEATGREKHVSEDDGTGATRGSTGVGLSKEVTEIMGEDVRIDIAIPADVL
jgi:hypothetical protein